MLSKTQPQREMHDVTCKENARRTFRLPFCLKKQFLCPCSNNATRNHYFASGSMWQSKYLIQIYSTRADIYTNAVEKLVANSGSRSVQSMVLVATVPWKTLPPKEVIEKMCFSIRYSQRQPTRDIKKKLNKRIG